MQERKRWSHGLSNWQFIAMMLLCVIVWALAFPFIKISLDELSFVNLTIMRFFVVCIVLVIILIIKGNQFSKLQKKDVLPIFILGFFGVMVYHLGLNYGEQYISPGAASLIIATIPVFIVVLAVFFLKERITVRKFFGVVLALVGVIVISVWGRPDVSFEVVYLFAAFAVLIAAVMGAFYTIAGKRLLERYSAFSLTLYAMLLGSLGLIPFINSSLFSQVAAMSLNTWFAVVFLGVFSTVIGYAIWYTALEIKTDSDLSIYLYLIPVFSTIVSYIFLDDEITFLFIIGGILVITGLCIVNLKNSKFV
jgi:drug/metabolite transporter (DMT)-like permease